MGFTAHDIYMQRKL